MKSYTYAVAAAISVAGLSSSPAFAATGITCDSPTNATSCSFFRAFGNAPEGNGDPSPGTGTDTFTFSTQGMKRISGVLFSFFTNITENVNFPNGNGAPSLSGGTLASPVRFMNDNRGNPEIRSINDVLIGAGTYTVTVNYSSGPNGRYDGFLGLVSAIPEPATWAMMIMGFGLVGGAMRTRKTAAPALAA